MALPTSGDVIRIAFGLLYEESLGPSIVISCVEIVYLVTSPLEQRIFVDLKVNLSFGRRVGFLPNSITNFVVFLNPHFGLVPSFEPSVKKSAQVFFDGTFLDALSRVRMILPRFLLWNLAVVTLALYANISTVTFFVLSKLLSAAENDIVRANLTDTFVAGTLHLMDVELIYVAVSCNPLCVTHFN